MAGRGRGAWRRLRSAMRIGIFSMVLLLAAGLAFLDWAGPLDRKLVDLQFRLLRAQAPRAVRNDVVIVGIDDESTRVLREPLTLWHPHLGKFLEAMAQSGAAAVGLDIVLPDRSYDAIVPGYDGQLLAGMLIARRTTPLVLALTVDPAGTTRPIHPAFVAAAGRDATGYALLPVDDDGVVRRFDERIEAGGSTVPTLAGQMARRMGKEVVRHGLIDYTAGKAVRLRAAAHGAGLARRRRYAEARGDLRRQGGSPGRNLPLRGSTRDARRPARLGPQNVNAPGVVVHAQALRNLLNDGLIAPVPGWVVPLSCLLAAMAGGSPVDFAVAAAALIAGSAAILVASTSLFGRGVYLPTAAILLTLAAAIGARMLYEASLQLRERRRLRRAFGAYVSPRILHDILQADPPPGLGGVRYRLCVLFADIRGFTARSERIAPEATIRLLNQYFSEVTESIHGAGGTLDKFIGDGVMAFFGAPQPLANPSCRPCARRATCWRGSRGSTPSSRGQGEAPIAIGIGLHEGDAVVGNMGSSARHNYTAIGDTVNVASRLEGLTKEVGYPLVCSAESSRLSRTARDLLSWAPEPSRGTSRSRCTAGVPTMSRTARRRHERNDGRKIGAAMGGARVDRMRSRHARCGRAGGRCRDGDRSHGQGGGIERRDAPVTSRSWPRSSRAPRSISLPARRSSRSISIPATNTCSRGPRRSSSGPRSPTS